jgi:hypothetical protein
MFKSKNLQLLEHGCKNEMIGSVQEYVLEYTTIKEHIVDKFRNLYSSKLYDNNYLWNVAFPLKKQQIFDSVYKHSYTPKILKKSRKMDKLKTENLIGT